MEPSVDGASLDEVVARLQLIRDGAGLPSFGDIAGGVSRVRRARGVTPEQARVGRTTVYDAFRTGRRRLDSDLVGDIVRALGGDDAEAADLAARCRAAQAGARPATPADPATPAEPAPAQQTPQLSALSSRTICSVLGLSLAMNLTGWGLSEWLDLPVYLDMVGTGFGAIVLGPWWGVLVGVSTNVIGTAGSGPESLLFAPVNAAGALIWGYGVRRWRLGRSIPRFFLLNLVVALVCTVLAVLVIAGLLGGFSESGADEITLSVLDIVDHVWVAVIVSNLFTSVPDKLIVGFVALSLIESLPRSLHVLRPAAWLTDDPSR